ncbi:hypothetical protein K4K52_003948 [Colletotrichum sp. SAR 10_76]|nr:hypothetical protein K4K51_002828 [Colletotrichum sp. SAR 10_75]KAI8205720.1 hypothetical protein K4K52_003948 [Colletotrichum sp. SAR 10_76]
MAPPSDDMISTPPEQPSSAAMAPSRAPSESTANQDELSASPDESSTTSSHPEVGSVRHDLDDLDDQREWGIKGIIGHRADPDDDTRVQLKIDWEPSDGKTWNKTWEPEAIIQQDAPDMWAAYTKIHDCRAVLGDNSNK